MFIQINVNEYLKTIIKLGIQFMVVNTPVLYTKKKINKIILLLLNF